MTKIRVGVAILVPSPVDRDVNVLRAALGDGSIEKIMPHVTLVAPINVSPDEFHEVEQLLREAAEVTEPFVVTLGPLRTFAPINPVLYLAAEPNDQITKLRELVFNGPLVKEEDHDFVPHATVCDEASEAKIQGAMAAVGDVEMKFLATSLHLLQRDSGEPWRPVGEFGFGKNIVGTGGLPVSIEVSHLMSPETEEFAALEWKPWLNTQLGPTRETHEPLVITARREGEIVGLLRAEMRPPACFIKELLLGVATRGQGIAAKLLAAMESEANKRQCDQISVEVLQGCEAEKYLRHKGFSDNSDTTINVYGRPMSRLKRDL